MSADPLRTLVVRVADWPLLAAGVPLDEPAVVVHANRVVASTPAARREGVRRGLRRREAEGRCPGVRLVPHDLDRDARAFEPVASAVEAFTPRVELTHPGRCAFATRGPARYFGGEEALAALVREAVERVLGGRGAGATVGLGIADGPFAAGLAARAVLGRAAGGGDPRRAIDPGGTPAFLAGLPTGALLPDALPGAGDGSGGSGGGSKRRPAAEPGGALPMDEVVDLLLRLGLRTLGQVAALPEADLVARFGLTGAQAWRRSSGLDERVLAPRVPGPDLSTRLVCDPPLERIDAAAFAARSIAAELCELLVGQGLGCWGVRIEADVVPVAESPDAGAAPLTRSRVWRSEGAFTTAALAERVRWQLDGWLGSADPSGAGHGLGGGVGELRLIPEDLLPGGGRQLGFWGGDAMADDRAERALARVQGLLGADAVRVAVPSGGRAPGERVTLVAFGDARTPARPVHPAAVGPVVVGGGAGAAAAAVSGPAPPLRVKTGMGPRGDEAPVWPGRLPGPPPTHVPTAPVPAEVVARGGGPVVVDARGLLDAVPERVRVGDPATGVPRWIGVASWAGPWPAEERWWDPDGHRRQARLQVVTEAGAAHLLVCEHGRWSLEATWD